MKRNWGLTILGLSQMLKAFGIDIQLSETDATTIGSAIGGVIAAVGVLHDLARKLGWMK